MISPKEFDSLDLILAGAVPPNPSELILGGKVEELLEEIKDKYDYIIFDTPPVGLITDALALMKLTHINIFVMSAKLANKKGIEFIEEVISKSKGSSGIVLNQIVRKKLRYYYKNSAYGYGSANSYTSD